jgi:hypothetical protein
LMAALALCFSLMAAFPGLKTMLATVRDGILWLALFFVLGGAAYVSIHAIESKRQSKQPRADRADYGVVERSR